MQGVNWDAGTDADAGSGIFRRLAPGPHGRPSLRPTYGETMIRVLSVVGTRPNFIKVGALHHAFDRHPAIEGVLVHTGQHYDRAMSEVFFEQLGLPEPDHYLGIGGGSHAEQTGRVMIALEPALRDVAPDVVVVVGDVNSTLAAALAAVKLHIPVAHVEAGLRSSDRRMPEEINRIATDAIADRLYVTERSGLDHLRREGIPEDRVVFAGNVMIDSLERFRHRAAATGAAASFGLEGTPYVLMTMHRPSTVDHAEPLGRLAETIERIAAHAPVVFPIHPRTRQRLADFGLLDRLHAIDGLRLAEPVGYLEFLDLMQQAAVVVTDSGGIQEETTALGVPCLTLRPHTERPVTVEVGTNVLLPLDPDAVASHVADALAGRGKKGEEQPARLDGRVTERVDPALSGEACEQARHYAAGGSPAPSRS